MGKKYTYYRPGYRPEENYLPPRREKMSGCLMFALVGFFACGLATQAFLSSRVRSAASQPEGTEEATAEVTIDAWGATGTAIVQGTFTPTDTDTPTATDTATAAVSPTDTATP